MNSIMRSSNLEPGWTHVCSRDDLVENAGVAALIENEQVALFFVAGEEERLFAVGNFDPIGKANVMSRGIVGDLDGEPVVASPLYKQHFRLRDGQCLEDESYALPYFEARLIDGGVWVRLRD